MRPEQYQQVLASIGRQTTLVAVSKMQPVESILQLYRLGQRDFGENYVQELIEKQLLLPKDIRWHFVGHLQSNKIKYIAPFVHLIQGVDSFKLLTEIDRQGRKHDRVINCLLQVHIAMETTKFGLNSDELSELVDGLVKAGELNEFRNVKVVGLMGMASFSDDAARVKAEFTYLAALFDRYASIKAPSFHLRYLSMGMSGDYQLALQAGSNMVRIGSLLFGERHRI